MKTIVFVFYEIQSSRTHPTLENLILRQRLERQAKNIIYTQTDEDIHHWLQEKQIKT
jgi:hypothetical protein